MPSHVALQGSAAESGGGGGGSAPTLGPSGALHAAGIAPDPGATAGTAKFLREDASWAEPAGGGGGGSDFLPSGTGHAAGLVPDPGGAAGAEKFLCEDGTWSIPDPAEFGPSGPSLHSRGAVPDPGATAGTSKFLREDATWEIPPFASTDYADAGDAAVVAAVVAGDAALATLVAACANKAANLSDLGSIATALANLGLRPTVILTGTTGNLVFHGLAGDDAKVGGYRLSYFAKFSSGSSNLTLRMGTAGSLDTGVNYSHNNFNQYPTTTTPGAASTGSSSASNVNMADTINGGWISGTVKIVQEKSGDQRHVVYESREFDAGSGLLYHRSGSGTWENTADELQDLGIVFFGGTVTYSRGTLETIATP